MAKKGAKMLTVREVAERIGAAEGSVRIWASRGRFLGARKEVTRFGDFWLIPQTALESFTPGKAGRPPKPKPESQPASTESKTRSKKKSAAAKNASNN